MSGRLARFVNQALRDLPYGLKTGWALILVLAALLFSTPARALEPSTCPGFLPSKVDCYGGRSEAGALLLVAKPQNWNGSFILFAHGGPRLGEPDLQETIEDLEKFQSLVRMGYAWAGTTYRRGGFAVRSAAADIEDLRAIVWQSFGKPKLTLLHGQSWGGNVAAKAAELYSLDVDGARNFDGVVLTSAVLAGGTRAYQLRADLRAVFQYYCRNHPAPGETSYPLWQGLPPGTTMSRSELARRVQACTGVGIPPAQRTKLQQDNARNITRVLNLQEDQILPNLVWATNTFQDLVQRLDGRNPFSNATTRYRGSSNDRALNAGIERFSADPRAVAQLAYDSDLTGLIIVPVMTLHGLYDPVARVCHQSAYQDVLTQAGRSDLLVQVYTSEAEHSRLAAPAYGAVFNAMTNWITTGTKPQPETIWQACLSLGPEVGEPCRIVTNARIPKWPC